MHERRDPIIVSPVSRGGGPPCLSPDEPGAFPASRVAAFPCEGTPPSTVRPRGLKPAAHLLGDDLALSC